MRTASAHNSLSSNWIWTALPWLGYPSPSDIITALSLRFHFPHLTGPPTLRTDEMDVYAGKFTDIAPDIWKMAVEMISSVLVTAAPVPVNTTSSESAADLSAIYPVVPAKRVANGVDTIQWDVRTHLDGSLTERTTGLDVAYLFWEAIAEGLGILQHESWDSHVAPGSPVLGQPASTSFSPTTYDLTPLDSVLLAASKITPYLDAALRAMALHTEARTSYWFPALLKHQHVALRFVPQAEYETTACLDITPAPDVVTRVFMVFKGVAAENTGEWSAGAEDPGR
ncbi:hypothetical protein C8R44DRAFT_982855 [Mycena epipterygia]|nr:hypothetical protein C8R44DRAFT_982855 [Mycena epipterygia]